ncbi:unnamed protein product [Notodromas monacha]|uniref:Tektin n=1 Tax=Notodromas monacha TaxID=399045 RepID=A0A7R9GAT9_9CRUS|nr:unnamed protein product [Notodromas monacha]CAG0915610.1 unnamed protein product [Notodromas monacha]
MGSDPPRALAKAFSQPFQRARRRRKETKGRSLPSTVLFKFWKEELQAESNKLAAETGLLEELRKNLCRALAETETPMQAVQHCLLSREGRQGIDLVHDKVQDCLSGESKVIHSCQGDLQEALRCVDAQLQAMREAQWLLRSDEDNKFTALSIDQVSQRLHNHSRGIYFFNNIEKEDPSQSVPETWASFSQRNVQRSQRERSNSQHLRAKYHSLINAATADMHAAWERSNAALGVRLSETTDARNKLQDHYAKVAQELYDVDKQIAQLNRSLQDKLPPLKVAQTRLENRVHRPRVELCRDPPHACLVQEVHELQAAIAALRAQLDAAEMTQQRLLRARSQLEADLKCKNNSIVIDREKCLGIRRSFPVTMLLPDFP